MASLPFEVIGLVRPAVPVIGVVRLTFHPGKGRPFTGEFPAQIDAPHLIFGDVVFVEDRLDGTDGDAIRVLKLEASLSDHIGHGSTSSRHWKDDDRSMANSRRFNGGHGTRQYPSTAVNYFLAPRHAG